MPQASPFVASGVNSDSPPRIPLNSRRSRRFEESSYYEISARLLRELIRRTVFATDNESSRYALGGVKLEFGDDSVTAIGTDGRRLAKMTGPVTKSGKPGQRRSNHDCSHAGHGADRASRCSHRCRSANRPQRKRTLGSQRASDDLGSLAGRAFPGLEKSLPRGGTSVA